MRVEVHVAGGRGGGLFAEVEEVGLVGESFGGFAGLCGVAGHALRGAGSDEHKAAAADVAGRRQRDGEREAYGDGGVDGIAAGTQDAEAGVGGVMLDGDDHVVLGADGDGCG